MPNRLRTHSYHKLSRRHSTADQRPSTYARGYGKPWERFRALYMAEHLYLCEDCARAGRDVAAVDLHHIIPLSQDGALLDPDNVVALCRRCHVLREKALGVRGDQKL